jgi:hypothetical protein
MSYLRNRTGATFRAPMLLPFRMIPASHCKEEMRSKKKIAMMVAMAAVVLLALVGSGPALA